MAQPPTTNTPLANVLLNGRKTDIVNHLHQHSADFELAMQWALANQQPLSWRAAWVLWSYIEPNDLRMQPYINQILDVLPHAYQGQQRELLNIITRMQTTTQTEGRLFTICIDIWKNIHLKPGLRTKALKILQYIINKYPELYAELQFYATPQYLNTLSPGTMRQAQRIIKQYQQQNPPPTNY